MKFTEPFRWRFGLAVSILAGAAVAAWALTWFHDPPLAGTPVITDAAPDTSMAQPNKTQTDDAEQWPQIPWATGPTIASSAPKSPAKPTRTLKLVAVMPRSGRLTACIQIGSTSTPMFLGEGDSRDGIEISSITRTQVEAIVDGVAQVLEMRP
jgi:hypothetical protein